MTRDDIYDHLAQVYLGKREKKDAKEKQQFSVWLMINIFITVLIFASAFYGLTAFLTTRNALLKNRVIFSLHNGPLRIEYNFVGPFPPVKTFMLEVPRMDVAKFDKIQLSVRAKEEGSPGTLKIVVKNQRQEEAVYYIQGIKRAWQEVSIPLTEFKQITDWTNVTDVSFVLESWNVENPKGIILIDDVRFSS